MVSVLGYQKLYKDKKQKQEGDVIVKENVKVITSDMDKKKKPMRSNCLKKNYLIILLSWQEYRLL